MTAAASEPHQHGVKGVYYGGDWLDIEDCAGKFSPPKGSDCLNDCSTCPRSRSRTVQAKNAPADYDICIIGAGCIGAAIARELSKYKLSILWLEAADDVSQGATKGNSGIVHAGYDDKPGTNHAKYCWKGNQMFADLDKELRFGYQKNGSLVVAFEEKDLKHLEELKKRGETNGVQRLRIVQQKELREMEPAINPEAIAALYAPDAGNVIPYEFTIALAENAVDNGVELRIRRKVQDIKVNAETGQFEVTSDYWEPQEYIQAVSAKGRAKILQIGTTLAIAVLGLHYASTGYSSNEHVFAMAAMAALFVMATFFMSPMEVTKDTSMVDIVKKAGKPVGTGGFKVTTKDMLQGGSGSPRVMNGQTIAVEKIRCDYVINCAGGASDQIAALIGDESFKIKPRLGDYILLNRNQGVLAKHTLFPCPDPILGKGVLVQTTLWGNLILGPTARDMHNPEAKKMSAKAIQEYILSKCKRLVPSFLASEAIHGFAGARAKSNRGDWIIEPSSKYEKFVHVAGIDSPGLAGSPAIALEVARLLAKAGLELVKDPDFCKDRYPIITPKNGMRGLKMGPVGKNDDGRTEQAMAQNVICKCEKVTELEVVRAMRRSLPIDSSQGIRKRTRAGMGHCQGDAENYSCEARVRAIIARESGVPIEQIGSRPWPATSTLPERWINDEERKELEVLKSKN